MHSATHPSHHSAGANAAAFTEPARLLRVSLWLLCGKVQELVAEFMVSLQPGKALADIVSVLYRN